MATGSVVVHDIDQLEAFGTFLSDKCVSLEELYDALTRECLVQERNWQDPQYDTLRSELEAFATAAKVQLESLDTSAAYISALVIKLREV